ncbi:MAG: porin [Pararhodobacter sp.]|nr:porin [Pararhodobacter sp.]
MKFVILTAGLLAVSPVVAYAQGVSIGGNGRMGVQYDSNGYAGGTTNWRMESRMRLNFSVTVEADHGLRFGAFTRVQTDTTSSLGQTTGHFSGHRVWAEGAGLRVTLGNQDGAIATSGTARGVGGRVGYEDGQQHGETGGLRGVVTRFGGTGATGANTGGQTTIHARYSGDTFEVAVSTERRRGVELAGRVRFDSITLAAGHQTARGGTVRASTVSAHYNGGNWGVTGLLARVGTQTNWSLAGNAGLGGGDVYGYVGQTGGNNSYGLSYGYGLGGGANLVAGGERVGGRSTASLGVAFRF